MAKTLLQKAKERKSKAVVEIGDEEVELALAWARGEINLTQASEAIGSQRGSAIYSRMALALKKYIQTKNL